MRLSDLLFPRRCSVCSASIHEGAVCDRCRGYYFENARAREIVFTEGDRQICGYYLFEYENDMVKKLVFALKEKSNRDLFDFAAELYGVVLPKGFDGAVTYVPRRRFNVRKYGYDHMRQIALALCKRENLKCERALRRHGFSRDQKTLLAKQRRENVDNNFRAVKKDTLSDVLLLDDVVTTKSTIRECSKTILQSNADAKITVCFLAL